ncbi:MAG: hypothetical protein ACI9TH_004603 [Kiritimatiellia bacterium]|jgi:hypothetical protein
MKESDMSAPLTAYLEAQGYKVNCEVGPCDMTALKDEELIVIELKLRMSLRFLYQGLNRKQLSESVYLALPVEGSRQYPPEFKNLKALLKRLEMGLILVRFMKTKTRVELIQHPDQWAVTKRPGRTRRILREIHARPTEYNQAGVSGQVQKMTAYRKRAIQLARIMSDGATWSPAQLVKAGCDKDSGAMLRMNHYGWFVREGRGQYRLDAAGRGALENYKDIE